MIRVISVDLGGVLFSEGKKVALVKLEKEKGYDKDLILSLLQGRKSQKATDWRRGLILDKDFWQYIKENLPADYDVDLIKQEWWDGYILDQALYDFLTDLKKNYKIIAFSGNVKDRINYLENKYHFGKLFDEEVYSFDCNFSKGDKEFYGVLIRKADCRPEEIIHIDDHNSVKELGESLGINVVLYERGGIEKLKNELLKFNIKI